jgi:hypothetical protein
MILISTLSEITKDNAQVFSVSEDRVVSVPDEFLCVAVDEAQESFQRFMTSNRTNRDKPIEIKGKDAILVCNIKSF